MNARPQNRHIITGGPLRTCSRTAYCGPAPNKLAPRSRSEPQAIVLFKRHPFVQNDGVGQRLPIFDNISANLYINLLILDIE